jgi:hypothetical protein
MVYCHTKNHNFGITWKALECKILVYFMTIWNFTVYIFPFWYVVPRKIVATQVSQDIHGSDIDMASAIG